MPVVVGESLSDARVPGFHKDAKRAAIKHVIARAGKHGRALELRAEGFTFGEISAILEDEGFDAVKPETVRDWVRKDLAATVTEPAEQLRQLEHFRLERLMTATWARAIAGHGESIDRVLRIMERKARLLGLDAPAEIDIRELRVEMFGLLEQVMAPEEYTRLIAQLQEVS